MPHIVDFLPLITQDLLQLVFMIFESLQQSVELVFVNPRTILQILVD